MVAFITTALVVILVILGTALVAPAVGLLNPPNPHKPCQDSSTGTKEPNELTGQACLNDKAGITSEQRVAPP